MSEYILEQPEIALEKERTSILQDALLYRDWPAVFDDWIDPEDYGDGQVSDKKKRNKFRNAWFNLVVDVKSRFKGYIKSQNEDIQKKSESVLEEIEQQANIIAEDFERKKQGGSSLMQDVMSNTIFLEIFELAQFGHQANQNSQEDFILYLNLRTNSKKKVLDWLWSFQEIQDIYIDNYVAFEHVFKPRVEKIQKYMFELKKEKLATNPDAVVAGDRILYCIINFLQTH